MAGVVRDLSLERRTQATEQAVPHAAQSPRVAMASSPQGIIALPGGSIVLDGDTRPVMDSALQPPVAGEAPDHEALLATLSRHRSNACQSAQGMVISSAQGLCGLGEQCGEIDPADSWPGAKDRHVALLEALPRGILLAFDLGAQTVQVLLRLLDLLIARCRRAARLRI